MRKTQELMRLAITQGAYVQGATTGMGGTCYMCNAMERLRRAGEITQVEERRVKRELGQYMSELCGDAHTLMGVACGKKWVDGPHLNISSRFHEDWAWAWNVGRVLYWNWDKRPRFMRETQEIFRAVIRADYYGTDQNYQSPYMCRALEKARNAECITPEEYARAYKAIHRYIVALTNDRGLNVMRLALNRGAGQAHSTYAWEHGAGRDFYWNWDKRPRLPKD